MTRVPITYNSPQAFADIVEVTGVSQTGAVLRTTGDNAPGTIYAAARTGGAYNPSDQALVQQGTGAAWFDNTPNAYQKSFVISGLQPGTAYWFGIFRDTGAQTPVLSAQFTTTPELPEATGGKIGTKVE